MPAYIVVVASFVTIVQFLLQAYVPSLYAALGLYIPLIVVNCIILGRAESFASKNGVMANVNVLGEEMEAFGLFHIASSFNREASCIVTAVDSKFSDVVLSGEERQNSLNEMITLALESIIK